MEKLLSGGGLLGLLKEQKDMRLKGGLYHACQVSLTYNSNHIEGSRLTEDQTRFIFETNTVGVTDFVNVDDIIETCNHFKCIDLVIDKANETLSEKLIKELHLILKTGTSDGRKDWFNVGEYKRLPNEVGGNRTTPPEKVECVVRKLLGGYNAKREVSLEDIAELHYEFEAIHPFQDGNGRVGRLIMLKEALKCGITPIIIDEELKWFYYRGLKEWKEERGYLIETLKAGQDKFARIAANFI